MWWRESLTHLNGAGNNKWCSGSGLFRRKHEDMEQLVLSLKSFRGSGVVVNVVLKETASTSTSWFTGWEEAAILSLFSFLMLFGSFHDIKSFLLFCVFYADHCRSFYFHHKSTAFSLGFRQSSFSLTSEHHLNWSVSTNLPPLSLFYFVHPMRPDSFFLGCQTQIINKNKHLAGQLRKIHLRESRRPILTFSSFSSNLY